MIVIAYAQLAAPVIGFFWILIELGMLPGDPGPNAYGPPELGTAVPA